MHSFRVSMLVVMALVTTAANRTLYDDDSVYKSLDQLAEILTVAQTYADSEVHGQDLIDGAINGLLEQLDPHTNYYNEDDYQTMKEDQHGAFYGIGIIVGSQNDRLTVVSPMAGAPAAMAGIKAGDVIAAIDDQATEELTTNDAIRLLRGAEGTKVRVKILRSGVTDPLFFTLTRSEIPSLTVRASFMADPSTGYIALKEFGETATDEVQAALEKLDKQGMKQVILDLRGNPGGLLPQAIGVASLFLAPEKLVVSTKGRMKNANQKFYTQGSRTWEDLPLILLIDRGSASASEIVSGAIQDHDRGLLVGVSSWGKGLVQSVFPLSHGATGLALTTSRYYTPSGRNIQGSYANLEDYYNPKSAHDEFFATGEPETKTKFKTAHGRPVQQVRGITPDVYVSFPQESQLAIQLENNHNAFFNFTTEHQEGVDLNGRNFEVDDKLLGEFKNWLADKKIPATEFDQDKAELRQKLTYQYLYTATSSESESSAWRYRMGHDRHVAAALELFPQARELLSVYKGEKPMRAGYTAELRAYARERDDLARKNTTEIASSAQQKQN